MIFYSRLQRYLMREFAAGFALVFLGLSFLVLSLDTVELLRRTAGRDYVPFVDVVWMAALKLPQMLELMAPFVFLFGGMAVFWRLNRSNELVVIRTGGVSVWQFLQPALIVAGVWGIVQIALFNPLAAAMYGRFSVLEAKYFEQGIYQTYISTDGLWIRQIDAETQMVVHANIVEPDFSLRGIQVFVFDPDFNFLRRLDAASAKLAPQLWQFTQVAITEKDGSRRDLPQLALPSTLTPDKIQESFAPPESLSVWQLPGFIRILEKSGFSASAHRLHFHALLTTPFMLMAMLLIAACFSITPLRQKRTLLLITGALLAGFAFYTFGNIVHALGGSGRLPIWLAAWSPLWVTTLLGISSLLHYEDG
jgi:lipopolysaccharide export system permease protein